MIFRRRPAAIRREQVLASLALDGESFTYLLKRSSARRSLSLRVNAEGMAQVNAPWSMSQSRIDAFLREHVAWLRQQLARHRAEPAWADGLLLPFLGGELRLEWRPSAQRRSARREGECVLCEAPEGHLEPTVIGWYHAEAESYLGRRLTQVCIGRGLKVPVWRLSDARTRWGSLSAKGVVSLNWRLIKASQDEIDYVICHELAHFRRRDHSAAFWREVAALFPDYQAMRERLRLNAAHYLSF
jgi:predicted metal-dependent hydrolase